LRSGWRRRIVRRSVSRSAACSLGVGSMMNSNAYTSVSGTRARLWLSFTANFDLRGITASVATLLIVYLLAWSPV